MKRTWIILTLSLATGVAAVHPCRLFTLRERGKAVNAHKLSKDRVAAIVAWNKEHPEWVKRWRAEHIIHDTEVLLCPEPTLDADITELLPDMSTESEITYISEEHVYSIDTTSATTGDLLSYSDKTPTTAVSYPSFYPAGYVFVSSGGTAATPESRTWVLLVIGIIVGVSYIQSFRSLR
jgi:hypothetical protein